MGLFFSAFYTPTCVIIEHSFQIHRPQFLFPCDHPFSCFHRGDTESTCMIHRLWMLDLHDYWLPLTKREFNFGRWDNKTLVVFCCSWVSTFLNLTSAKASWSKLLISFSSFRFYLVTKYVLQVLTSYRGRRVEMNVDSQWSPIRNVAHSTQ